MKTMKIKMTKRKMQLLESALWRYRYTGRLSMESDAMANDLCERLRGMHSIAPWGKEAKVKFTSSEAMLLESALKFKLMCTEDAKAYLELFNLYEHIKKACRIACFGVKTEALLAARDN